MLSMKSCSIGKLVIEAGRVERLRVGVGTADLAQDLPRREIARPGVGIGQQFVEGGPLMGVGDGPAQAAPEPLDPVAVGVVSGGVNAAEVGATLLQQGPDQARAPRRV